MAWRRNNDYSFEVSRDIAHKRWTAEFNTGPVEAKTLDSLRATLIDLIQATGEPRKDAVIKIGFTHLHGAVKEAEECRLRARRIAEQLAQVQEEQERAAKALKAAGIGVRDAAEILGVSPQRVGQLEQAQPESWLAKVERRSRKKPT